MVAKDAFFYHKLEEDGLEVIVACRGWNRTSMFAPL